MIHIYMGDGKGKTTAAMGLALRAAGNGWQVVIIQFLKNGKSGELAALTLLPAIRLISGKSVTKFSFAMTELEKAETKKRHDGYLWQGAEACKQNACQLLVLDESIGAVNKGLLDQAMLDDLLLNYGSNKEIVLTGREPSAELLAKADYVTNMKKIKHPYDQGIMARIGVEK